MSRKRNYIFTTKNQSKKAIMATALGLISLAAVILSIFFTYQQRAEAPVQYGSSLFLATIFAMTGIVLAFLSIREKESYRFFPYLGLVLNCLVVFINSFILFAGAYGL